ncbi:ATP-binding protein [Paenibacillus cremeus]|uniref:histidine kinase n=1 Tax=Paenibacillus cremeus TaxID=2163881 RepID=A0A559K7G1_9BACL|nr:ATP-binding protein [Paenibacillus cremeus]TVY08065.1 PAS domain S-box protein [Paenibacillus cremeus]
MQEKSTGSDLLIEIDPVQRGGNMVKANGTYSDVPELIASERTRAEAARRRAGEMTDLIGVLDENGRVVNVSPSHVALLEQPIRQFEGRSVLEIIHPEDVSEVVETFRFMLRERKPVQLGFRIKHGSGSWISVEANGNPIMAITGAPVHFVVVSSVVSGNKRARERGLNLQKFAIVERLAEGMAREIRGPLATLKGIYGLMKMGMIRERYYRVIDEEFNRLETIIADFLAFANPEVFEFKQTNLDQIISEAAEYLESQTMLRNIQLLYEKDKDLPYIHCDRHKIKQVLVNVLNNAMDSVPYGGDLRIQALMHGKHHVRILIKDQGCGGRDGLMICKEIIKKHQGLIEIQSKLNQGTTVTIILPLANSCEAAF